MLVSCNLPRLDIKYVGLQVLGHQMETCLVTTEISQPFVWKRVVLSSLFLLIVWQMQPSVLEQPDVTVRRKTTLYTQTHKDTTKSASN